MTRTRLSLILATALSAQAAAADVPVVIADIPPVQSLVAQVMGDLGTPVLLVEPGAEAHSFQLRPSQMRALVDARLVFWVGHEMTPWLERALEAQATGKAVALLDAPGTSVRSYEADGHAEDQDHAGEEDHAHEEDHAADDDGHDHDNGHDHTGADPHAWLDPDNALVWLDLIAAELSAADPEHAATYEANRDAAKAGVAAAAADVEASLVPDAAPIIVGHEAYGYFADRFGVAIAAAVAEGDAADPGAAHLAAVQDAVAAKGVRCIFGEAGHDPRQVERLAEGSGARVGGILDPEGQLMDPGPALYGDLLRALGRTIGACQAEG